MFLESMFLSAGQVVNCIVVKDRLYCLNLDPQRALPFHPLLSYTTLCHTPNRKASQKDWMDCHRCNRHLPPENERYQMNVFTVNSVIIG